ncbi:MAG: substrate-binding domain-containing protein, partial [Pseudomonadota bacterium]
MKHLIQVASATVLAVALVTGAAADDKPRMGVVVKIGGIPWFNAMEVGIKERGEELGVDAFMIGPTSADPALQVRAIEDLIAQGVDAIGVVPNDEEVLEPVLTKAREAGLKVVSHEGPGLENVDFNFELASADGFGEAHADLLAEKMGGEGKYAVFVGSLTVPLHNAWADAAIAHLSENFPGMEVVGERHGVAESADDSRRTALELMSANPDLEGFLAFGSQGPIGAGRAVEERRRAGEVYVLGPFSPGQGRNLIKDDVISGGFMWNPMEAGKVFVTLGKKLIDEETVA